MQQKQTNNKFSENSYISPKVTVVQVSVEDVLTSSPATGDIDQTKFIEWKDFWN